MIAISTRRVQCHTLLSTAFSIQHRYSTQWVGEPGEIIKLNYDEKHAEVTHSLTIINRKRETDPAPHPTPAFTVINKDSMCGLSLTVMDGSVTVLEQEKAREIRLTLDIKSIFVSCGTMSQLLKHARTQPLLCSSSLEKLNYSPAWTVTSMLWEPPASDPTDWECE